MILCFYDVIIYHARRLDISCICGRLFSPTETTFQLCLPWLNDVVHQVISEF